MRRCRGLAPSLLTLIAIAIAIATAACDGKPAKAPAKETERDFETPSESDSPPPPEEPVVKKGPVYPAPFTWEEIRAATKSGRTYRYRVEVPGEPPRERVVTFVKVDADGCEIFSGGERPKRLGWPTLQKHTEFPQESVTPREETVKLPGGKFDCMVYEVAGDDGEVTTYFFARNLPGAPVLFYTEQDGTRVKTTTLLQHIPGKR